MAMFRFSHPEYFYLLLLLPALLGIYALHVIVRRRRIRAYGSWELVRQLMPEVSFVRGWVKHILLLLAIVLMVAGLAGPQFGSRLTEVTRRGIELIIVLDVSNSMLARDFSPNRLERAKMAVAQLTGRLTTDRLGLIVFAYDAYVQLPITSDHVSARMFLDAIGPGTVPVQGTAMGRAINLAMNSFSQQPDVQRAIVVISDGENHEDDPVAVARRAAELGIVVHTIGVGSPQGAPIPMPTGQGTSEFLRDRGGNVVITRLDEETLVQTAIAGGGRYIRATNAQFGLQPLFEEISQMERVELEALEFAEYEYQFQYLFAAALLLILLEVLLLERKNRYLRRINLFGDNK